MYIIRFHYFRPQLTGPCFCCGLTSSFTSCVWPGGLVRSFSLAAAPAELVRTDAGSAFGSTAGAWGKNDVSTGEPGGTGRNREEREDKGSRVKAQKASYQITWGNMSYLYPRSCGCRDCAGIRNATGSGHRKYWTFWRICSSSCGCCCCCCCSSCSCSNTLKCWMWFESFKCCKNYIDMLLPKSSDLIKP